MAIMSLSIAELKGRIAAKNGQAALPHIHRGGLFTNTELDRLLAPSGVPRGRMTEVFGAASSGKTSVALALLAACTVDGLFGAYIDPAGSLFAPAAAGAGVCLSRLLVVRPPNADVARRAVDALVRCGACALVVFDCAGLGDALRTHQCARLAAQAEKTGTALVALSSGNVPALAYFASLRLRTSGLIPVWQEGGAAGGRLAGCVANVEVVKSRMSAPGMRASVQALLPDVAGSWPIADEQQPSNIAERERSTFSVDRRGPSSTEPDPSIDERMLAHA